MTLRKRKLGKSGIEVTEMGLGLWAAGGGEWGAPDSKADAAALSAIDCALNAGVNFFDTSDVYGAGHSERLLAQAMRGRREQFVVASKIGWQGFDSDKRCTAYGTVAKLIAGVETNLKRLETDYLDIIQSHIDFRDPTMEIFIEGFEKLKKAGKVRGYGVSTSDFQYLKDFNANGNCATLQVDYSILNRTPEADLLNYCRDNNIGVIVRGALAMGLLAGKFTNQTKFPDDDFRSQWLNDPKQNAVFQSDLKKVERLKSLAKNERTLAQAALQFVLTHEAVSVVIPGARDDSQVLSNLGAISAPDLSNEDFSIIDQVTPRGGGRKIWPA